MVVFPEADFTAFKKWQLVELIKRCNAVLREKYPKRKRIACQNKSFSNQELNRFFAGFNMPYQRRFWMACNLSASLGLRPCEVVSLKDSDIDLQNRRIQIINSKVFGRIDTMPLKSETARLLQDYCRDYGSQIKKHHHFVFFAKHSDHWSPAYLRNKFQRIRKKVGLRKELSLYSFRHWFVNRIWVLTHYDLKKTQLAARHSDPRTTLQFYVESDTSQVEKAILAV